MHTLLSISCLEFSFSFLLKPVFIHSFVSFNNVKKSHLILSSIFTYMAAITRLLHLQISLWNMMRYIKWMQPTRMEPYCSSGYAYVTFRHTYFSQAKLNLFPIILTGNFLFCIFFLFCLDWHRFSSRVVADFLHFHINCCEIFRWILKLSRRYFDGMLCFLSLLHTNTYIQATMTMLCQ